jgi:hypothetical protein
VAAGAAAAASTTGAARAEAQEAAAGSADDAALAALRETPLDIGSDALAPLDDVPGAPPGFATLAERARSVRPFRRMEDLLVVPGVDAAFLARLRLYAVAPRVAPRLAGHIALRAISRGTWDGARLTESAAFHRGAGLRFGGLLDRDAGERDLDDFRAGWFEARCGGAQVVAGAFDVDWGLGATLSTASPPWGGAAMGRRALRAGRGLTPHRGTAEETSLRGVAASLGGARARLAAFYSDARRDAFVRDGGVTSLPGTGLHRTARERAASDRLRDRTVALRAEIAVARGVRVGGTARADAYAPAVAPGPRSPLPAGSRAVAVGVDALLAVGPVQIGTERAALRGGRAARVAAAQVAGALGRLGVLARRFDPEFRALHTAPLGRLGRPANERGVLVFAEVRRRSIRIEAHLDRWAEIARRRAGDPLERGTEAALALEAARNGRRAALGASRRVRATASPNRAAGGALAHRVETRDAIRVDGERAFGAGFTARVRIETVAEEDAAVAASRTRRHGRLAQLGLSRAGRAGLRTGFTLSAYGGDAASVVPRIAESFTGEAAAPAALASADSPSGWRALLSARRPLARALRVAAACGVHAPRGGRARLDWGFGLELGRDGSPAE